MTFNSVPQSIGLALFKVKKEEKKREEKIAYVRSIFPKFLLLVEKENINFDIAAQYTQ